MNINALIFPTLLLVLRLIAMYFLLFTGFIMLRELIRFPEVMRTGSYKFPGIIIVRPVIWGTILYATYLFETFYLNIL